MRTISICFPLLLALTFAACGAPESPPATAVDTAVTAPEGPGPSIESLQISNARTPSPDLLTAGQITREQMAALHAMGYRTFINLRPPNESGTGWEEEFAAAEGIDFLRIPVPGASGVTRENAQRLADALQSAPQPTVLYCGSGNRVGALLAIKAHLLDGQSAEDALALGQEAGLTRLEPQIREMLGLSEPGS